MKPFAKQLIKFCTDNVGEIKGQAPEIQSKMMSSCNSCVLRPFELPDSIRGQMTAKEFVTYTDQSVHYADSNGIDDALLWVKRWVNK